MTDLCRIYPNDYFINYRFSDQFNIIILKKKPIIYNFQIIKNGIYEISSSRKVQVENKIIFLN